MLADADFDEWTPIRGHQKFATGHEEDVRIRRILLDQDGARRNLFKPDIPDYFVGKIFLRLNRRMGLEFLQ